MPLAATPPPTFDDCRVAAGPPGAQLTHSSADQIKDLERHVTWVRPYAINATGAVLLHLCGRDSDCLRRGFRRTQTKQHRWSHRRNRSVKQTCQWHVCSVGRPAMPDGCRVDRTSRADIVHPPGKLETGMVIPGIRAVRVFY